MGITTIDELIREDGTLQTWAGIGGYRLTFLDVREYVVCDDCAAEAVTGSMMFLGKDDLKGAFIHWEGAPLECNECSCDIESEYGDPDEDEHDEPEDIGQIQTDMARHARENIRKEAPWIIGEAD